ncbi:MAG TPA: neutral zinc metallopeptidase [Acidimicrobiia bacterium]|nr:neutral zinc metallopeptidase [Acidimicrobiia bacterium]
MRRVVPVLALVLLASACGDDTGTRPSGDPFAVATTVPTTASSATTSTSATTDTFRPTVREAFMAGCTEDGSEEVCACTLQEIERRITLEQFLALDDADPIDRAFIFDVTEICLARLDGASIAASATTTTTTTTTTSGDPGTTTTTAPPRPLTLDEVIQVTVADLESYWEVEQPAAYGTSYEPIERVVPYVPSSESIPDCGDESITADVAADNAFYCNPDDYIAWDAEGLFPGLFVEFGDFTIALVLAHEWGHAVQNRVEEFGPTIQTELQADCFAGSWTGAISRGEREALSLDPGDIEEAMSGYLLFRDPPGTGPNDPGAHGSAFDRVNAFRLGLLEGVDACRQASNDFPVAFIPVDPRHPSGNLPYAQLPLLSDALEVFWAAIWPGLFEGEWVPVSATVPYYPSTGEFPACGDLDLDPGFYADNAFYCPEGDFVAWDDEVLFPALYQSIGDMAIGHILAHEWATAVQARAGLPSQGLEAELQADCTSGAFAAALTVDGNPTGIQLSAGDLDEAVATFIQFGEDPEEAGLTGGAFDRFDAFQEGFFGGIGACFPG